MRTGRRKMGLVGGVLCCLRAPAVLLALSGLPAFLFLANASTVLAQQGPSISLPASITVTSPGQTVLGITVAPPGRIPAKSFVRLRGLPPMAALSEGHSIAPGAWAVSLSGLSGLTLTVPASASGRFEILATLVDVEGTALAEARAMLSIGPPSGAPTAATVLRGAPPALVAPPAAAPPGMTPEDRERALRLFKRGQTELADANIAAARVFFERAADAGLAEAALALGGTFDSAELQRLNIRGAAADAREARRWYERAAQLGAAEASARLQRLGKN